MIQKTQAIRVVGPDAIITLNQGAETVIDASDVPLVERWNWFAKVRQTNTYVYRNVETSNGWRMVHLHRVLMGDPEGLHVDHIDGDALNNRRANLRLATHSENMRNRKRARNNTSGYKGVSWAKGKSCWQALICFRGKQTHLGYFVTPEAAYERYCEAALRLHGDFACTK